MTNDNLMNTCSAAAEVMWAWVSFSNRYVDWEGLNAEDPEDTYELVTQVVATVKTCFGENFPISNNIYIDIEIGSVDDFDKDLVRMRYFCPHFVLYVNTKAHYRGLIIRDMFHIGDQLFIYTDEYCMMFQKGGLDALLNKYVALIDPVELLDDPVILPRDHNGYLDLEYMEEQYDTKPSSRETVYRMGDHPSQML